MEVETKSWRLDQDHELRLDCGTDPVIVKLVNGTAEMFGTEMVLDKAFTFTNRSVAIFTWHGCTLEVQGTPKVAYQSDETPMTQYINVHQAFEGIRASAHAAGPLSAPANAAPVAGEGSSASTTPVPVEREWSKYGPRVLLVGGTDSGKSTLSRILANYAVRAQRTPLLVDLDCGQNDLAPPGCVAACQLLHPASIDHESSMAFNASSLGHAPITYFYGHTSPMVNEELYRKTISSLATAVFKKMDKHDAIRSSGCIINTCGLVEGAGYGLLLHAAQAFRVSAVLVIDNERLYNELKSDAVLRDLTASFVKLPKSGGAVVRDKETRERARANKIREYFYGIGKELAPHQRQVRENDVHIVKFTGVGKAASSSLLPIGVKAQHDSLRVVRVPFANRDELTNSIMAVSYCSPSNMNSADLLCQSNVAGFVYCQGVDLSKARMMLLAPCPGPLPAKVFLLGSLKWFDEL